MEFTPEQDNFILENKTKLDKYIATELGTTMYNVSVRRVELGCKREWNLIEWTDELMQTIFYLKNKGDTFKKIGETLGIEGEKIAQQYYKVQEQFKGERGIFNINKYKCWITGGITT